MKVKQYVEPHPQPYAFINAYINKENVENECVQYPSTEVRKKSKQKKKKAKKKIKDKIKSRLKAFPWCSSG